MPTSWSFVKVYKDPHRTTNSSPALCTPIHPPHTILRCRRSTRYPHAMSSSSSQPTSSRVQRTNSTRSRDVDASGLRRTMTNESRSSFYSNQPAGSGSKDQSARASTDGISVSSSVKVSRARDQAYRALEGKEKVPCTPIDLEAFVRQQEERRRRQSSVEAGSVIDSGEKAVSSERRRSRMTMDVPSSPVRGSSVFSPPSMSHLSLSDMGWKEGKQMEAGPSRRSSEVLNRSSEVTLRRERKRMFCIPLSIVSTLTLFSCSSQDRGFGRRFRRRGAKGLRPRERAFESCS